MDLEGVQMNRTTQRMMMALTVVFMLSGTLLAPKAIAASKWDMECRKSDWSSCDSFTCPIVLGCWRDIALDGLCYGANYPIKCWYTPAINCGMVSWDCPLVE